MKSKFAIMILTAWGCIYTASAIYAPEYYVPDDAMPQIRKSIAALKTLPKPLRETYIADSLRLCFSPSGGSAYGYDKEKHGDRWFTYSTAHFVGSDGKVYPLWATANRKKEKREEAAIAIAKKGMDDICAEAVFAGLADEVTEMCIKTAKNRLEIFPAAVRDCFIAEKAKLLYLPGGGNPYTGEKGTRKFYATNIVNDYDYVHSNTKFIDSKGVERDFHETLKLLEQRNEYSNAWDLASLCVKLCGEEEFLFAYAKEWEAMKMFRKKVSDGSFIASKNVDKETNNTKNSEIVTYVSALKGLPRQMREAYLAERLGLCFMPDGKAAYEENSHISTREGVRVSHYHAYNGARFIGSNGKEYDLYASMEKKSSHKQGVNRLNRLAKEVMKGLFGSAEDAVVDAFSKEVHEMFFCTAKNRLKCMPPLMQYALLAEEGDLLLMTDGRSAYTGKMSKWRVPGTRRVCDNRDAEPEARFYSPDGKMHEHRNIVQSNWERYGQSWLLVKWCIAYIGKDKILALYSKELKEMKAHINNAEKP